jgi:hypothetical protein
MEGRVRLANGAVWELEVRPSHDVVIQVDLDKQRCAIQYSTGITLEDRYFARRFTSMLRFITGLTKEVTRGRQYIHWGQSFVARSAVGYYLVEDPAKGSVINENLYRTPVLNSLEFSSA